MTFEEFCSKNDIKLNECQKQAVYADGNCVVSAGAGSGKTMVLAARFLRLVMEKKADCDRILTITFTRKATSEMKSRIHSYLMKAGLSEQLKLFSKSSISTVDGFCAQITRSDCTRYGIPSDFTVIDSDDLCTLAKRKVTAMLAERRRSVFVEELLSRISVEEAVEFFSDFVCSGFNITSVSDPDSEAENMYRFLKASVDRYCEKTAEILKEFISCLENDEKQDSNVLLAKSALEALEQGDLSPVLQVKFNGRIGAREFKEDYTRLNSEFTETVSSLGKLVPASEKYDFIREFYRFTIDFEKEMNDEKRSLGVLTFTDVLKLAIDILKTNSRIRKACQTRYRYVMIDEFQDNNNDYRILLNLITQKQLFLVGDEKQSIYRFRGADVTVFKDMITDVNDSGGTVIELDTNFRSSEKLLNFFNSMFSKVMKNGGEKYEASFKALKAGVVSQADSRIMFLNYHCPSRIEKKDGEPEMASVSASEAEAVACLIDEMLNTDLWKIRTKEGIRRPSCTDIALLLKKSTNQSDYEKALRIHGIDYNVGEVRSLGLEAVANDIYSVLQLCIWKNDSISAASFRNGPLAESDIEQLMHTVKGGSICDVLAYIWYDMDYRSFIVSNGSNQVFEQHFDYLYALGAQADRDGKNIVQFLDMLRPLLGNSEKLKELTVFSENSGGVSIMTVHKSKGLGFPIVIAAGLGSGGGKDKALVSFTDEDGHLFLPCCVSANGRLVNVKSVTDCEIMKACEQAELRRLFYVAATRACDHLVFAGSWKDSVTEQNSITGMIFSGAGYDSETDTFGLGMENRHFGLVPLSDTVSRGHFSEKASDEMKAWYEDAEEDKADYSISDTTVTELSRFVSGQYNSEQKLPSIDSDLLIQTKGLQTVFGTLTHSLLEKSLSGQAAVPARPQDVSESEWNLLERDAALLADNFLSSALFAEFAGFEKYTERAFAMNHDKRLVEGRIDLLCIGNKELVVFDFKTDITFDEDAHRTQLEWYIKAMKSLYPDYEVSAYVVMLRDVSRSLRIA